ncbi:hypothetical protein FVEN_g5695 [Fusarium venenatum]|uniref:Enoyl reductase (ER) domain-containing protein n=1 Tax=Fusarium venenatum TaxID=56646 RepID=A0A2L2TR79_9HYPO|nr:uncharacterized protein FVRRES_04119 [Fusarium venenatum]KAG8356351.1 hypothetical protein FVEN_g5695 [Fusarium venenatum]CEI67607.1 unnamed protein product [Fusarium venenatum]
MAITKALFVDSKNHFKVIEVPLVPKPGKSELLIKVLFSGVNPADIKHATQLGINNTAIGYDFAGQVIGSAENDSNYETGDIVAGYTPSGLGRPVTYGTHQTHIICPEDMLFRVPDNLPLPDAASLTTVAMTAADAVYNRLGFPLPSRKGHFEPNKPFLLWGATSSVGYCALQLSIASGVSPIFVTAKPEHFEHLRSLGIAHLFDYRDPDVHKSIAKALQDLGLERFEYAFDAAGAPDSGGQVLRAVSDVTRIVSTVLRDDKRFTMPVATPGLDFVILPPGAPHAITIPARPADHKRAWEALTWAIENYGRSFRLPPVRVATDSAERVLEEIQRVVERGSGFSKLTVKQPLQ